MRHRRRRNVLGGARRVRARATAAQRGAALGAEVVARAAVWVGLAPILVRAEQQVHAVAKVRVQQRRERRVDSMHDGVGVEEHHKAAAPVSPLRREPRRPDL